MEMWPNWSDRPYQHDRSTAIRKLYIIPLTLSLAIQFNEFRIELSRIGKKIIDTDTIITIMH